jgi:hypothetical protein
MRPSVVLVVLALAGVPLGCETAQAATTPVSRVTTTTPVPVTLATTELSDPVALGTAAGQVDPDCLVRDDLDVLFIGNSYTIAHDLPQQVAEMAHRAGLTMRVQRLAIPGKNLEFHSRRRKVKAALASREWDFVVIQGQSLEPLQSHNRFVESGSTLAQMVWDAGATPVLFETWPRKVGHPVYRRRPRVSRGNPSAMQHAIHDAYIELATLTNAEIVPAGEAWMAVTALAPDVNLYDGDLHHPGRRGSYLNASLLFAQLTNVSPVGNVGGPMRRVEPDVALMLQEQAAAVVKPECRGVAP